ncbi:hypothetical protein [Rufibacter latericius]|uniref:DUF3313 domain-containing protein n=1 Tax=Rufibacter latericius TaxID=2487040 RepID=A0A3M9MNB1_9BACT|nr:hypothetical protein [Rufibacter latericius]RNI27022.1 hypothetical protein EFB08_11205 [Rufibacter latericius]
MKMRSALLVMVMLVGLGVSSCNHSRNIYTSPAFEAAAKHHKTIAILPFDVQVGLRPNQMRRFTPEQLYALELQHGRAVQSAFQIHFLNKINGDSEKIAVQDVNVTNSILKEQDIQPEELQAIPPAELAQMLGVDAVLVGSLTTEKPVSTAVAAAIAVYTFLYTPYVSGPGPTNTGNTTMRIYDGASGNLLWSYDKMLSRGIGSDTHNIIRAITRKATRQIPYAKR